MTRYFYTDALAAAWMQKHFGMRFDNIPDPVHWHEDPVPEKIYIHRDSERLLRVDLGDIVSMTKAMDRYAAVSVHELKEAFNETGDYRIIQRNGIAFMWPESEAANV
jgi:hypothetical protein